MLTVSNLWKSFDDQPLLRGVNFQVQAGETLSLLGPSGSGKSTILRIIAGLEEAESGLVLWDETDLSGVPAYRRNFGLMFQDYALFPHKNVAENVAFGLRMQGLPAEEVNRRVGEALQRVNLAAFARRRVTDLSGGEQQRVALARALAPGPRLIMLDEPLAALDRTLREQLGQELRSILHDTQIPAIYVTHDQEEAFTIADRLILLQNGQVAQSGTPAEVYAYPASAWVARFFGLGNILEGKVASLRPLQVETPAGRFEPACPDAELPLGAEVFLLLRPTGAAITAENSPVLNRISGLVEDVIFRGDAFRVRLRISPSEVSRAGEASKAADASDLSFLLPHPPPMSAHLTLCLSPENILCIPKSD